MSINFYLRRESIVRSFMNYLPSASFSDHSHIDVYDLLSGRGKTKSGIQGVVGRENGKIDGSRRC